MKFAMPMDGRTQRTQLSRLNIERTAPQATGRFKASANAMSGLVGVALSGFFALPSSVLNHPYGRVGLVVCYVGPFYINEQMVADGRYI